MLQVINEDPIEDEADIEKVREAQIASLVLEETKKEVLSDEWDINVDEDYTFPVDSDGFINIPSNVLDLYSSDGNLIMRNWKLYDKRRQSDVFDSSQNITVVWNPEFNSLTHPIRNFITVRACKKFQARQVTDPKMHSITESDERDAYILARRSESRSTNASMLDNIDIIGGFNERSL